MKRQLLAVDVGNSHTTLGLFADAKLSERWRVATPVARTGDELWVMLMQFLQHSGKVVSELSAVSISSVVPELTFAYCRMAEQRLHIQPLVITADRVRSLRIHYHPPSSVGADRLCGAVAAYRRFRGPLIVVDVGTATVFDVVSRDGVYLGGLIAPGIQTAIESLHGKAALLPRVESVFPPTIIGRDTETAIQSGVLHGTAIMIDGVIDRIERELGEPANVVATGGFAEVLRPQCRRIQHVEPYLVLEGIRLITDEQ